MTYIDIHLVPVPRANKRAYEDMAALVAKVLKEYGALRVLDSWLDESGPDAATYHGESANPESQEYGSFMASAGANPDEMVAMCLIEWPARAIRDMGMKSLTSDPRIQFEGQEPVFDGKRLIAAGFKPILVGGGEA